MLIVPDAVTGELVTVNSEDPASAKPTEVTVPPALGNTCVYEIELEPSVALVSVVHKNKSSA